jgi:hypothetical protein
MQAREQSDLVTLSAVHALGMREERERQRQNK